MRILFQRHNRRSQRIGLDSKTFLYILRTEPACQGTASGSAGGIIKAVLLLLTITAGLFAAPAAADSALSPSQYHLRDSLRNCYFIGECCGSTLKKCLDKKKHCTIADRLDSFLTWIAGYESDPDPATIKKWMDTRYTGFTTDTTFTFDTTGISVTGNPDAPVRVMVYVSAYCPSCKRYVTELRNALLSDSIMQKKTALYVKPAGKGIGNIALLAAVDEGKFWELFLAYRRVYTILKDTSDICRIAAPAGVLSKRFVRLLSDTTVQQRLQENREESWRNDVTHFPAYFINGKKYSSSIQPRWVIDAIEFEYERQTEK